MIKVNRDACIGCGSCCMLTDNKVFDIDDDGLAFVKDDFNYDEEQDNISMAIENCPTSAISDEQDNISMTTENCPTSNTSEE